MPFLQPLVASGKKQQQDNEVNLRQGKREGNEIWTRIEEEGEHNSNIMQFLYGSYHKLRVLLAAHILLKRYCIKSGDP